MKKLVMAFAGVPLFVMPLLAEKSVTFDPPKVMIVNVDVADVRSEPKARIGKKYVYDDKQETQVLKGERVEVLERRGKWMRIRVPDQAEFTHSNDWESYPGWVELKYLSDDLTLEKITTPPKVMDDDLRRQILSEAKRHLGNPYLWGGRSIHNPKYKQALTGVDCSGLVNWSYGRVGWIVPRDAHEQSMKAQRIEPAAMKPGDLIFLAKAEKPEKIIHVAMYEGNGMLIEAPQSGDRVREISIQDRFGKPLSELSNDLQVGDRIISFGTFFPEVNK